MTKYLDTTGMDRALLEDFDDIKDIRSYIASKYGHEYVERVIRVVERREVYGPDSEPKTRKD